MRLRLPLRLHRLQIRRQTLNLCPRPCPHPRLHRHTRYEIHDTSPRIRIPQILGLTLSLTYPPHPSIQLYISIHPFIASFKRLARTFTHSLPRPEPNLYTPNETLKSETRADRVNASIQASSFLKLSFRSFFGAGTQLESGGKSGAGRTDTDTDTDSKGLRTNVN